eukprot:GCRY01003759.1.p1 GENE.GCRY01003759.1~~GCRY01003759.1.p1  ORF type:complete len:979 (+),score=321.17 GCRY01003759.1:215-3151(+)
MDDEVNAILGDVQKALDNLEVEERKPLKPNEEPPSQSPPRSSSPSGFRTVFLQPNALVVKEIKLDAADMSRSATPRAGGPLLSAGKELACAAEELKDIANEMAESCLCVKNAIAEEIAKTELDTRIEAVKDTAAKLQTYTDELVDVLQSKATVDVLMASADALDSRFFLLTRSVNVAPQPEKQKAMAVYRRHCKMMKTYKEKLEAVAVPSLPPLEEFEHSAAQPVLRETGTVVLRIVEARGLKTLMNKGTPHPYITVEVDDTHHLTTPTIPDTTEPFFSEEGVLDTPAVFDHLTFTMWDGSCRFSKWGYSIGRAVIPYARLSEDKTLQEWFKLTPAPHIKGSPGGTINITLLKINPVFKSTTRSQTMERGTLDITVHSVSNLITVQDSGALTVQISTCDREVATKPQSRSTLLTFEESFKWELDDSTMGDQVLLSLWEGTTLLGQTSLWLAELREFTTHKLALDVCPQAGDAAVGQDPDLGEIKASVRFSKQQVLPQKRYEPFLELLTHPSLTAVSALLSLPSVPQQEIAKLLVSIFECQDCTQPLFCVLVEKEVLSTANPDIIFRGNSLASRCIDYYMKLVGLPYLQSVLTPVVSKICADLKGMEVDPTREPKASNRKKNWQKLKGLVRETLDLIFNSVSHFPASFFPLFSMVREVVTVQFPDSPDIRYTAVSGFIFLRFFCAGLLGPKLFGLTDMIPEEVVARSFTLVSKTVISLSNLTLFGEKEAYMTEMNDVIAENMGRMKQFLDTISGPAPDPQPALHSHSLDLARELAVLAGHFARFRKPLQDMNDAKPHGHLQKLFVILDNLAADLATAQDLAKQHLSKQAALVLEEEEERKREKRSLLRRVYNVVSKDTTFLKYPSNGGKPKPRSVVVVFEQAPHMVDPEHWGAVFTWKKIKAKTAEKQHRIPINDITHVTKGFLTPLLRKGGNVDRVDYSFSVVTNQRTVDLEAETKGMRDEWVKFLRILAGIEEGQVD